MVCATGQVKCARKMVEVETPQREALGGIPQLSLDEWRRMAGMLTAESPC